LYSTASYQAQNLAGVSFPTDLTRWNLAGQNLTNADLSRSTLIGTNFNNAIIRGASFRNTTSGHFMSSQLYSTASYKAHDLTGIDLSQNILTAWNLSEQNLSNANFDGFGIDGTYLTRANLSQANLTNANFRWTTLIDADLSEANLTDASFFMATLNGANLSQSVLTNASFSGATLANADFTNAVLAGTYLGRTTSGGFTADQFYSTASYKSHDLRGVNLFANDLSGWDFSGQNLTDASFSSATLTEADFTNAIVRDVSFQDTVSDGFTSNQLYSTASYQIQDLAGIELAGNDLSGWDFIGQNLTNAKFVDDFRLPASLTYSNFTAADMRGAAIADLTASIFNNAIRPDGRINGLQLTTAQLLVVRDYHGDSRPLPVGPPGPIQIVVDEHVTMDATGALRLRFEDVPWDSLISFAPGIPVTLGGGKLELEFAAGVDIGDQYGRTIRIFDWTGVSPIGTFHVVSPYAWDLSQLYSTGQIKLIPEPTSATLLLVCLPALARRWARRACPTGAFYFAA
jgi:uncharacterized protein YjbI with pentapeptide repeats